MMFPHSQSPYMFHCWHLAGAWRLRVGRGAAPIRGARIATGQPRRKRRPSQKFPRLRARKQRLRARNRRLRARNLRLRAGEPLRRAREPCLRAEATQSLARRRAKRAPQAPCKIGEKKEIRAPGPVTSVTGRLPTIPVPRNSIGTACIVVPPGCTTRAMLMGIGRHARRKWNGPGTKRNGRTLAICVCDRMRDCADQIHRQSP